jgi:hypothetical protein
MMRRRLRSLRVLCALVGAGCYEYLPASVTPALVGARVQLSLTDSGTVAMARQVGPSVEAIEGTLAADSSGAYVVAVALTRARGGAETDWRGERVAVARPLVASIAQRRFSRSRSAFAGALMTAGVVAVTTGLRGGGESSGGLPGSGKTPGQ